PTVVVFPVPLTPTTRITAGRPSTRESASERSRLGAARGGRASRSPPRAAGSDGGERSLARPAANGRLVRGALDLDALPESLDELGGRLHAEVGGDEGVLDLLPGLLVEPAA